MFKHIVLGLKKEWDGISNKSKDSMASGKFCLFFFFFIIVETSLLHELSIESFLISLACIFAILLSIISYIAGSYSADYIHTTKMDKISYIPIGKLKDETKKKRVRIMEWVIFLSVALIVSNGLLWENSIIHRVLFFITILLSLPYVLGFIKYWN